MVANYWPVAAQKEENGSPFPVKVIDRSKVTTYLQEGRRFTFRGITLYIKPTDFLEVGFLIRRKAGRAVDRNRTRRLFRGLLLNRLVDFRPGYGYLFLFHHRFQDTAAMLVSVEQIMAGIES